jgi:hypothetical protein
MCHSLDRARLDPGGAPVSEVGFDALRGATFVIAPSMTLPRRVWSQVWGASTPVRAPTCPAQVPDVGRKRRLQEASDPVPSQVAGTPRLFCSVWNMRHVTGSGSMPHITQPGLALGQ